MTANANNIKAALAGGGAGLSLAWFAPVGTAAPTTTSSALNAAFLDAGICVQDGLTEGDAVSTVKIPGFGTQQPVRVLTTGEELTFKLGFLETNPVSEAIYYRKALGSIVPTVGTGAHTIDQGVAGRQLYAAVFDIKDGADAKRVYCPTVELTNKDDLVNSPLDAIKYGVELTAYPDSTGLAVRTFLLVASLG